MNPDRQQALDYLRAPASGLWRWAESGAVLVWRDGSTIAFREEIIQILEWLAPNGLPSFGAIVFLLAACRGKVPKVADLVSEPNARRPAPIEQNAALLGTARAQLKAQLESAIAELAKVPQLAAELSSEIKARAKCVLAEAVFEPAKAERHVEARLVLRGMQEPMNDADLVDPDRTGIQGSYVRQIHIVAEGLKPHTAESLALRLRTSLDTLPKEPDVNLPIAERARELIEELSRDREYGVVARAARELMAAVRLPHRLGEREQLPIGGVADITNRGALDRLLLSELAHDDLTLSVRVALNEALYLRREPPMREPPGTLALLLDSGVRLWGMPRVLAAAVALALIARDKQHREVLAWRAHEKHLQPVDLLSSAGLRQHLGTLETNAHPGESLPAFAEAISTNAENQSVLITHRDALGDPEFRRALAESPVAPGFIAAVDREGRFELHALPLARRPPLCEAELDVNSLFDERKGVLPVKTNVAPDLPAILGMNPFPFLLPVAGKLDHWCRTADGFIYAILNDRRLIQYRVHGNGARVLAVDLPGGKTTWMDCVDDTVHAIKEGASQRPIRLLSINLPYGALRIHDLAGGPGLLAVHRYGDAVLLIRRHDVRAYALSDGRLLGQATNPHAWMHGRFFRGTTHIYFAVWDGERVKFESVTMPNYLTNSVIAQVFDREGMEGPWLIHQDGMVISTIGPGQMPLPMPPNRKYGVGEVRISRDGQRIYLAETRQIKDLTNGRISNVPRGYEPALESIPSMPRWNLYRIIDSFARVDDGLALSGRKNHWRILRLDANQRLRIVEPSANEPLPGNKLSFSGKPVKTSHGCTLDMVQSASGSKVFLDSRGLLHLKSCDSDLPEVTLVLSDGEVAGWTSDGHVCGPSFFFDGTYTSEPLHVFHCIKLFLATW